MMICVTYGILVVSLTYIPHLLKDTLQVILFKRIFKII